MVRVSSNRGQGRFENLFSWNRGRREERFGMVQVSSNRGRFEECFGTVRVSSNRGAVRGTLQDGLRRASPRIREVVCGACLPELGGQFEEHFGTVRGARLFEPGGGSRSTSSRTGGRFEACRSSKCEGNMFEEPFSSNQVGMKRGPWGVCSEAASGCGA